MMKALGTSLVLQMLGFLAHASPSQAFEDTSPPRIVHQVLRQAKLGHPVEIEAYIYDQTGVFEPKVYYRRVGAPSFSTAAMVLRGDDRYVAVIPAEALSTRMQYFVEAFDLNGNGPARHGTPDAPHEISLSEVMHEPAERFDAPPESVVTSGATSPPPPVLVEARESTCAGEYAPVYCKWWFWSLVSLPILAAGGLGLFFGLRSSEPEFSGAINLDVIAPDPRP